MTASYGSTLVLIPSFNASATLPRLVEGLKEFFSREQIVIIDDGSTDETKRVATELQTLFLQHDGNRGKGAALETGFRFARSQPQFKFLLTIDSDLQHKPDDVPSFFLRQQQTNSDMVIGKRKRFGVRMPAARILSNTLTSVLVSMRTGIAVADSQCGFRLFRRRVVEKIFLETTGYEAETEMLIKAAQQGFSVSFAPIQTVYGNEKSHMTHAATTKRFLQTLLRQY